MPRMMERLVDNLCLRVRLIGHRVGTSAQGSYGSRSSHYFADTCKLYREYLQNGNEGDSTFPI